MDNVETAKDSRNLSFGLSSFYTALLLIGLYWFFEFYASVKQSSGYLWMHQVSSISLVLACYLLLFAVIFLNKTVSSNKKGLKTLGFITVLIPIAMSFLISTAFFSKPCENSSITHLEISTGATSTEWIPEREIPTCFASLTK